MPSASIWLQDCPGEPAPAEFPPAGGLRVIRQKAAGGVQSDGLGDEVVIVLGAGIEDGGGDAPGMLGNGGQQTLAASGGGAYSAVKDLQGKGEGQDAQGDFLTGGPVGAEVGGIAGPESFCLLPEGGGVFVLLLEGVCPSKGEYPAKAGGFPDEFDVLAGAGVVVGLRPVGEGRRGRKVDRGGFLCAKAVEICR